MSASAMSIRERWRGSGGLPAPDAPGGMALALAMGLTLVYALVLVAEYSAMTTLAWWVTSLTLVLAVVGAFSLSSMLGNDIASFQRLELDLARTVLAYVGSGAAPASDAPLSGVWRAYVGAAEESRRVARSHAYALGPFVGGGLIALAAVLVVGLGLVTSATSVIGVALILELFAFFLLFAGVGVLVSTAGYSGPVPGFDFGAARRWRRNAGRQNAVDGALSQVPWLAEFARSARESRVQPKGPSAIPGWRP